MKKLLLIIFLFIISILNVQAEDLFKITAANFDTSNSIIVINSPDESTNPILQQIKLVKLDNPKRAYFDIPNTILTIPKQDWNFNNTDNINEIKISQFSTNPNTVRVVIYHNDNFDVSNIEFLRLKNNIIIKLKNSAINDEYFHRTYRDEHSSANDFYENLAVEIPNNIPKENMVDQIQQAFNTTVQQTPKMDNRNLVKKDLKLNSRYYINQITPRHNAVLLSGFGAITIEKPMVLTNPSRLVYDIPNTVIERKLRNCEYQINETDSVKVGQFEVNKARVVITTPDVTKYIPIYSTDNQSILIANKEKVQHTSLFSNTSDIIAYNVEKNDARTNTMYLSFNHPLVHGIDRLNSKLVIYLYNVSRYNEDEFKNTFSNTLFANADIKFLQGIGMKLTIPTSTDSIVNTYLGADSKILKLQVTEPKKMKAVTNNTGIKHIVLDPGHGGGDCGALKNNVFEKDINLEISKMVKDILVKKGYKVSMTREDDSTVSLQERVEFTENINPDIFISIHVNSSEKPEITGVETHYYHQESLDLAQTVHSQLASNIKTTNRGLFKSKFYVINHTTVPAILVEIGFLSNEAERAELLTAKRKQETAKAISKGVENYFKR